MIFTGCPIQPIFSSLLTFLSLVCCVLYNRSRRQDIEDFKKDDEQEHSLRHLYTEGVWTDQCQFSLVGLGLRMQKVMVANFGDNWHLGAIFPPLCAWTMNIFLIGMELL